MTEPLIRVDQIWERKGTGRRVRVTALLPWGGRKVRLEPIGHGRASTPKVTTLWRDFRLVAEPQSGDWP